jgi:hypothetical protein
MKCGFIVEYAVNTELRLKVRSEKLEESSKNEEEMKGVRTFL